MTEVHVRRRRDGVTGITAEADDVTGVDGRAGREFLVVEVGEVRVIPVAAARRADPCDLAAEATAVVLDRARFRRQNRVAELTEDVLTLVRPDQRAGAVPGSAPRVGPGRGPGDDERLVHLLRDLLLAPSDRPQPCGDGDEQVGIERSRRTVGALELEGGLAALVLSPVLVLAFVGGRLDGILPAASTAASTAATAATGGWCRNGRAASTAATITAAAATAAGLRREDAGQRADAGERRRGDRWKLSECVTEHHASGRRGSRNVPNRSARMTATTTSEARAALRKVPIYPPWIRRRTAQTSSECIGTSPTQVSPKSTIYLQERARKSH